MANFSISYLYQVRDKMTPVLKKITRNIDKQNDTLTAQQYIWAKLVNLQARFNKKLRTANRDAQKLKDELANSWDELIGIAATAASIMLPVQRAMEFESAMAGVAKAANLEKGTEQFIRMEESIRNMTKEIPRTAVEIAQMFEAGARLGISQEDLPEFARLTARTAVAFDLMAEQAGDSLASISAKMGLPISKMESMMDAVNQLENTTSAKGNQMIEIIGRISGAAKAIELSPEQTAGLAAFANQITVSPELAASGLDMMINRMQKIPALHKKLLESPEEAISGMLGALNKLDKIQRAAVINKVFGDEAGRFVQAAVGSLELYSSTLGKVADNSEFAGSMNEEFQKQLQTTAAQAQIAKNGLNDMAISLGNRLLPFVYKAAQGIQSVGFFVGDLVEKTGPLIPMIAAFAGTLAALQAAALLAKVGMLALNIVMAANPIGLVIAGVSALVASLMWAYDKFEAFRNKVDETWATIKEFFGWGANDLNINVNQSVNGKMQPGDAGRGAGGVNGSVAVDINAPQGVVGSVYATGQGVKTNQYSYLTGMAGYSR